MCLAQGPQRSDAGEARTAALRSRVKHSTTEPLHSLKLQFYTLIRKFYNYNFILIKFPYNLHLCLNVKIVIIFLSISLNMCIGCLKGPSQYGNRHLLEN